MAAGFAPGTPSLIFSGTYYGIEPGARAGRTYDIAPDGQWFLFNARFQPQEPRHLSHRDPGSLLHRIAVNPTTDRRKCHCFQVVRSRNFKHLTIAVG